MSKTIAGYKTWVAKFDGTCPKCNTRIREGKTLVCREAPRGPVIHYVCHKDWRPASKEGGKK